MGGGGSPQSLVRFRVNTKCQDPVPRRSDWGNSQQWADGQLRRVPNPTCTEEAEVQPGEGQYDCRGEADKDVTGIAIQGISAERN